MRANDSIMFRYAVITAVAPRYDQETLNQNLHAKVDVYDYAAQFDTLPSFQTSPIPIHPGGKGKVAYHSRITVHGTTVVGEGFASTTSRAEIAACITFK